MTHELNSGRGQQNAFALLITALALLAVFSVPVLVIEPDRPTDIAVSDETDSALTPGSDARRGTIPVVHEVIGRSVRGTPIERVTIGDGPVAMLLMASIHGNEAAGTPMLLRLVRELQAAPELVDGRCISVIPMVNPDGVSARTRFNSNGVDLNRNFPADNRQNSKRYGLEALSEPEALAIWSAIESIPPAHIVTLHEPLNCVDYDGPAAELAEAMSDVCPLAVKKLGSRPGSLGSYAGVTLGIPTVTFELPRNARDLNDDQLWALYGNALLAAVRWSNPSQSGPLSSHATVEQDGK